MSEINIGGRIIGEDHPPLIIVEIGINHEGSLDLAKQMVDQDLRSKVRTARNPCATAGFGLGLRLRRRLITLNFKNTILSNDCAPRARRKNISCAARAAQVVVGW